VWALYAELDLTVVVHAGWGMAQGYAFDEIAKACQVVDARNGTDMDLIMELMAGLFSSQFFADLGHRRALWQLMLGGVLDRHPGLRVMFTEVRADWIPATLDLLDAAFDRHRADLRATTRPSELWSSNCIAGVSFIHKVEIERRQEIGVDSICFGRDYPHAEGTWPNTLDYLRALFAGVPEADTRKILGENLIGFLGLDAARIAAIADRVGPALDDVTGGTAVDPALLAHFGDRCGYDKPFEGDSRIAELAPMLDEDLARLARTG
jgi:predicted TIM-barrel fold metal-dependent hydrolase